MPPDAAKQAKLDRLAPLLQPAFRGRRNATHYDCLDEDVRRQAGIVETENVSENPYHLPALQLFERHREGLVLDVGAGRRAESLPHVVNLEVVDYPSTDVLSVAERLPFEDGVFDAVHSNAVLEHVRDPAACAREMVRVLKPGGDLMCCVPFLQPYHGYPHHYYNMTQQGLGQLFGGLQVLGIEVYEELRPVTALQWLLGSWASALPPGVRERFLELRVGDVLSRSYAQLRAEPFVALLPPEKNRELACANTLFARKPGEGGAALRCDRAIYGAGSTWFDVTAAVARFAGGTHLFISCNEDIGALFGDPAPGVPKQLRVAWRRGETVGQASVWEQAGRLATPLWI